MSCFSSASSAQSHAGSRLTASTHLISCDGAVQPLEVYRQAGVGALLLAGAITQQPVKSLGHIPYVGSALLLPTGVLAMVDWSSCRLLVSIAEKALTS